MKEKPILNNLQKWKTGCMKMEQTKITPSTKIELRILPEISTNTMDSNKEKFSEVKSWKRQMMH